MPYSAIQRGQRGRDDKEGCNIAKKDEKLKGKDLNIARKTIGLQLQWGLLGRGQSQQLETIIDPLDVNLTEEEVIEPPHKRAARTEEDAPKSALAVQYESIKEAVKVKEENINDYVSFLQSKIGELTSVAEAGGAPSPSQFR